MPSVLQSVVEEKKRAAVEEICGNKGVMARVNE